MNQLNFEKQTGIKIPILSHIPVNKSIYYKNPSNNKIEITSVLNIFNFNHYPLLQFGDNETNDFLYYSLPLFEEKRILPFAEDGGGYFFCLDFNESIKSPKVVLWIRENEDGEDITFLANSFEEFIHSLKSEDEIGGLLKE